MEFSGKIYVISDSHTLTKRYIVKIPECEFFALFKSGIYNKYSISCFRVKVEPLHLTLHMMMMMTVITMIPLI